MLLGRLKVNFFQHFQCDKHKSLTNQDKLQYFCAARSDHSISYMQIREWKEWERQVEHEYEASNGMM